MDNVIVGYNILLCILLSLYAELNIGEIITKISIPNTEDSNFNKIFIKLFVASSIVVFLCVCIFAPIKETKVEHCTDETVIIVSQRKNCYKVMTDTGNVYTIDNTQYSPAVGETVFYNEVNRKSLFNVISMDETEYFTDFYE